MLADGAIFPEGVLHQSDLFEWNGFWEGAGNAWTGRLAVRSCALNLDGSEHNSAVFLCRSQKLLVPCRGKARPVLKQDVESHYAGLLNGQLREQLRVQMPVPGEDWNLSESGL
jgi:hypothetical protein